MKFEHSVLKFSIEIPDTWKVCSYLDRTAVPGFDSYVQKNAKDLPAKGDYRHVLAAQKIVGPYDEIRCHLELAVWQSEPFPLPTRAKKYPFGELPFKARIGKYGEGGVHAAGQLDLGNELVMHIVTTTRDPNATADLAAVLATGKRLA
jgi:hypothetical protein